MLVSSLLILGWESINLLEKKRYDDKHNSDIPRVPRIEDGL